MIIANQNLFNTILVFAMLSFTMTVNAASSVARAKCTSVEQEIIDFKTLETEIRNTKAIGGLSKLSLSGDINKMVDDLKKYHEGDSPHTLEQHREQYDLLYMKVVSQVQDKDPELFNKLCNAWDPLWAELQDVNNLKKVSQESVIETGINVAITDVFKSVMNTVIPLANAEEILSHEDTVKKDLLVVVVAHGVVCSAVTVFKKITNHDYVATCEGGDKYRVNVSEDGRVNVAPHQL